MFPCNLKLSFKNTSRAKINWIQPLQKASLKLWQFKTVEIHFPLKQCLFLFAIPFGWWILQQTWARLSKQLANVSAWALPMTNHHNNHLCPNDWHIDNSLLKTVFCTSISPIIPVFSYLFCNKEQTFFRY